jgi:N-acetylmuramoyl-L-alanine amidase
MARASDAVHARPRRARGLRRRVLAVTLALAFAPGVVYALSAPGAQASSGAATLLAPPRIVKDLIPFGARRKQEMRAYAMRHYDIDSYRLTHPHLIVWHYTESATFQSVWNTFASDVPDVSFHELPQVCAHFVIDTNGTIYQLVPLDIMCRHVVGLNYTAIGIENVGFSDQQVMGDAPQFRAALQLTQWLRCSEGIAVAGVIGHNESLSSPYYRELVAAFRGQTHLDFNRADMTVVRERVAALPCRA